MGLLDDAIREHLDLKRRRGADPTEVARLEQEALGPVRRGPAPPAPEEPHEEAPEPVHHGAVADEPVPEAPDAPEAHEVAEAHDEHDHDDVAPAQEERLFEAPEPDVATTEYRVEDEEDDEEAEAELAEPPAAHDPGEDVLEETPDFLQETPEHDRLWFEQRPPRDFDFDG